MKGKAAAEMGIKYTHVALPEAASASQIIREVEKLNGNDTISGILVQLPLGDHISKEAERSVTEAVSPEKDVDGCACMLDLRPLVSDGLLDSTRITLVI
jgi:methylenetetrahydrofolate dehydrogenase (NADP+)/methenyltetrahydrofolate cyclohydrolase/formyltetrahydrofolate synthetase